jgi:hypothetical protein
MPKVIAEKPSLPTLWVDTAVGIRLARIQEGANVQDIARHRMVKLKELVVKLGRSCKLLCPQGEQEFEYLGRDHDDTRSREFAALSRGIRMLPRQAVHDSQALIAMAAYVDGDDEVRLPSGIYFHTEPIRELQEISKQKCFASSYGLPPMPLEMHGELRDVQALRRTET